MAFYNFLGCLLISYCCILGKGAFMKEKISIFDVFDYIKCYQINYKQNPSIKKMTIHFNCCVETIIKKLNKLEKLGYIFVEGRKKLAIVILK